VVIQFMSGDRGGGLLTQVSANREEKEIAKSVKQGKHRDRFALATPVYSASLRDVIECNRHRPQIMHFTGHGEERKLLLIRDRDALAEMQLLQPEQIEALLANYDEPVRLVVFNTCRSLGLARHITEKRVAEMAIGVEGLLNDDQAVQFAAIFYGQLAEGVSVRRSFNLATVHFAGVPASAVPQLLEAQGVDAGAVIFGERKGDR
jgi:hypothetical protein